jgi:hypothetical protein
VAAEARPGEAVDARLRLQQTPRQPVALPQWDRAADLAAHRHFHERVAAGRQARQQHRQGKTRRLVARRAPQAAEAEAGAAEARAFCG